MDDPRNSILLRRRTEELKTLVRVAQFVNIVDLDHVLAQTLEVTAHAVNASKGSFFLLDNHGQPIQRFITQRDMPPEVSREVARDVVEKGLAGWCLRHQTGAVVSDVQQDERWYVFPDDDQVDVRSAVCVPVAYENQIQGIMTLVSPVVGQFDLSHLQLVTAVANQASTAIRNARLFDTLRVQQRQLEIVLQNTGEALLNIDMQLNIVLANPEAVQLLELPIGDNPHDHNLNEFADMGVFAEIVKTIHETDLRTGSHSFEYVDEALKRDYAVTIAALTEEPQPLMPGYVIAIHEVTSLKDLSRLKTHMLHMLTHDLKNPINIIWGYVDLLRIDSDKQLPADPRFVEGVLRAVQRMENLIEETLNAEKFMAAGVNPIRHRIEVNTLVEDALTALRPLAENKRLNFVEEIDLDLGEILGARVQIQEAMINFIGNAIKYTPEGGTVRVKAIRGEKRFAFIVEDTGMGIPAELQNQLFKKFYRAQRPAMAGIEGTGLGLSLVKSTVEYHQGQVWFKSEEGVGSTFGFWIPLAAERTTALD